MYKKKGFTLIELLLVITVIGILASLIFVNFEGARERAKIAKTLQWSQSIHSLLGADAVGVWNFNDRTAKDSSGSGNHGTIHGAVFVDDTPSGEGWALQFDGVDDYVDVGNDPELQTPPGTTFTYEAWIRGLPGEVPNEMFINRWLPYFRVGGGRLHLSILTTVGQRHLHGNTRLSPDTWYHAVATFDGEFMRVYLNGRLDGTPTGPFSIRNIGSAMRFGVHRWGTTGGSHWFRGLIDEVRIYNRALTAYQIQYRYAQGLESLLAREMITVQDFNDRMAELEQNLVKR